MRIDDGSDVIRISWIGYIKIGRIKDLNQN